MAKGKHTQNKTAKNYKQNNYSGLLKNKFLVAISRSRLTRLLKSQEEDWQRTQAADQSLQKTKFLLS